jgi:hypothetical protein
LLWTRCCAKTVPGSESPARQGLVQSGGTRVTRMLEKFTGGRQGSCSSQNVPV